MFGREPVLWMALIQAILAVAVGFGLHWTGEQVALVTALAAAILAFVSRSQVTPNVKLPVILLCIVLLSSSLSACSSAQLKIAIQAENQVHDGLGRARTAIVTICPESNLSQMCSTTKSAYNDVLDAAIAYNRGLRDKDLSKGVALIQAIDRFVQRVQQFAPELKGILGDLAFAREGVKS